MHLRLLNYSIMCTNHPKERCSVAGLADNHKANTEIIKPADGSF